MQPRALTTLHLLLATLSLALVSGPLFATTTDSHTAQQRQLFLAAEQALINDDRARYNELAPRLDDYPLLPYLRYRELRSEISLQRRDDVHDFILEHADTPLAWQLHRRWLEYLAREQHWGLYVADFRPAAGDTALRCQYLYGLMQLGHETQALAGAEHLWLTSSASPAACDPLFSAWQQSPAFDNSAHVWTRIELAMTANQPGLARSLRSHLPAEDQPLLDTWLALDRRPRHPARLPQQHPEANPDKLRRIERHLVLRLLQEDSARAINAWRDYRKRWPEATAEDTHTHRRLALILAVRNHEAAGELLAELPERDENTLAWQVRWHLSRAEWDQALEQIKTMPESLADQTRWQYWRARALEERGQDVVAREIYESIAGRRNFHAFLASDRLDQPYAFAEIPMAVSDESIERLAASPAFRRIAELRHFGLELESRREWEAAAARLTPGEIPAAAHLALRWGMPERAIRLLAENDQMDDLHLRFPVLHADLVTSESSRRQLDPSLPLAVIRRESSFDPEAISPAGARGLMQIMPGTGQQLAASFNESLRSPELLHTPERNLRYGIAYLQRLFHNFDDHPALALGAYNAGSYKVRKWTPAEPVPADVWIETLPYAETRSYIEAVLSYQLIYQRHLGQQPMRLSERLTPIGSKSLE